MNLVPVTGFTLEWLQQAGQAAGLAGQSHWVHSSVGQGLTRPTLTWLHLSHPSDASKKGGERSGLFLTQIWSGARSCIHRKPQELVESGRITLGRGFLHDE